MSRSCRKRTRSESPSDHPVAVKGINPELIAKWETAFNAKPMNLLAKNAVGTIGSYLASSDPTEARKVTHIFMNTLKKHHLKATNQGRSGRCWLFAGMNTFRHFLIRAMNLETFEFSETYLYFWDKLERANTFLQWFVDHSHEYDLGTREVQYMLTAYRGDGGYWDMFANLVSKYGLVPLSAMPETYQSSDSEDMNQLIEEKLNACINWMYQNHQKDEHGQLTNRAQLETQKLHVVHQLYDLLVKFLGQPPNDFTWFFTQYSEDEGEYLGQAMTSTPQEFTKMILPPKALDINDFVMLGHYPNTRCQYNRMYQIRWTSNVAGGRDAQFLNLPIAKLKKYAMKSILAKIPVWFAGDVRKGFDPFHSALNADLNNNELLFGKTLKMTKGQRLDVRDSAACHAMVLIGVNINDQDQPTSWQVENSWGFCDNEQPGLDGFLSMSDQWFEDHLYEIVVHKKFLTPYLRNLIDHNDPVILDPWDSLAPAIKVGPVFPPANYLELLSKHHPRTQN